MSRWLWRYIYRLRTNNNTRANTLLLLVGVGFLFNLFVFGITPEPYSLSSTAQSIYSAAGIKTQSSWGIWDWLRWANWKIWWVCFGLAIIYRIVAWRDELHRAWQTARHHMTEIRQGVHDLTPGQPTTAAAESRLEHAGVLSTWLRVFIREFIAAILGDIITENRR
jgi:hypothetical protein